MHTRTVAADGSFIAAHDATRVRLATWPAIGYLANEVFLAEILLTGALYTLAFAARLSLGANHTQAGVVALPVGAELASRA